MRLRVLLPSYSSTTSAGTLTRGRRVTLRTDPQTVASERSASSAIGVAPWRLVSSCSSRASNSSSVLDRRVATRENSRGLPSLARFRWSFVMAGSRHLVDLGDLWTTFERLEIAEVRGRGLLVGSMLNNRLRLIGQFQCQQLTGRHGLIAAHDDCCPDHVQQHGGRLLVDGRAATEDRAQEPTGAIDTDEARRRENRAAIGALTRHPGLQLGAQRTGREIGRAALAGDAGGDLVTDVEPDTVAARRGKGLQLNSGLTQH